MEHTLRLRKGAWTSEEDDRLRTCIGKYGEGQWHRVPLRAGLNRCRKSCRLRWLNYLKPNIKRGDFASDEVDLIIRMHKLLGNRWSLIAGRLPGRTANDVKNHWNTHLKKQYPKKEITTTRQTTRTNIFKPRPRTFSAKFFFGSNHPDYVQNIPNTKLPAESDTVSESSSLWWQNLIDDKQFSNNGESVELTNGAENYVNDLSLWSDLCLDDVNFWDLLDAPRDDDHRPLSL